MPLIRKYNLPDTFEFSQSYTFFWDKVERANYFLEAMIELVDEPVDVIYARLLALRPSVSSRVPPLGAVPQTPPRHAPLSAREHRMLAGAQCFDAVPAGTVSCLQGRLVNHLLQSPLNDGGQWDMFVAVVQKCARPALDGRLPAGTRVRPPYQCRCRCRCPTPPVSAYSWVERAGGGADRPTYADLRQPNGC